MPEIAKSFGLALLYVFLVNISPLWMWPLEYFEIRSYLEYYELIQGFILLLLVLVVLFFLLRKTDHRLLNSSINGRWYLIALVTGVLFIFFQSPLNYLYNFCFKTDYLTEFSFPGFQILSNPNFLSSVIFIPIAEELFFRGYIQGRILNKINPYVAILTSTVIFSLLHAPYENLFLTDYHGTWHHSYITFFGGLIASAFYQKTKSTLPSILFHATWNLMANLLF